MNPTPKGLHSLHQAKQPGPPLLCTHTYGSEVLPFFLLHVCPSAASRVMKKALSTQVWELLSP